jgi:hypothetical protein
MCWHGSREFEAGVAAPSLARRYCAEQLRTVFSNSPELPPGKSVESVIAAAELVVSELVTNAVQAGSRSAEVTVSVHRTCLELRVGDDAGGHPELLDSALTDNYGRGLLIVDALSGSWGVRPTATGKQVWAKLSIPDRVLADLRCDLVCA